MIARLGVVAMVLVAALLTSGCGCCNIEIDLEPPEPIGRDEPPDDDDGDRGGDGDDGGGGVNLGTASYPKSNDARRIPHGWWLPKLKPKKYRLKYQLGDRAAKSIHGEYRSFARKVGHKKLDRHRFQWKPPRRCFGGLHCVYEELEEGSAKGVEPLTKLFRRRAKKAKLKADQVAALVVTFVQEIEYRVPKKEPFGVMPPALLVRQKWGDCDSKSLLAHMILRDLGIKSVLISSEAHKHTMLGVRLPTAGTSFTWSGSKYAFVELTAKRSPIGHINPKLLRPNDWRVVRMRYKKPKRR